VANCVGRVSVWRQVGTEAAVRTSLCAAIRAAASPVVGFAIWIGIAKMGPMRNTAVRWSHCYRRRRIVVVVIAVAVVVDLYSTSRSASNDLIIPLRHKKMSFHRRSEDEHSPSMVPEWVWKQVPFHWTHNGESSTTKRAATVSWNHQLVTVGRSKALAETESNAIWLFFSGSV